MVEMSIHGSFYRQDELFSDEAVCATRSHVNVIQTDDQPYQDGEVLVWLDGEFYKQDKLFSQYNLSQQTDPVLLASLYRQTGGLNFLRQVEGVYVACLYDRRKQKLHLISDRYGMGRLYWTVYQNALVWTGELKSLLSLPNYQPKIDRAAMEDFLGLRYMIGDRSWFENVELLPAATVFTWDIPGKTLSRNRYWGWDELTPLTTPPPESEAVETLGHLFVDAVQSRVYPGERVGLTLSGGLDSRAILAAMPDHSHPVNTITHGRKDCEDYRIAAQVAAIAGDNSYFAEMNAENWLFSRVKTIWETDAYGSFIHFHFLSSLTQIKTQDLFNINLHGAWGDVTAMNIFDGLKFPDVVNKRLGLEKFALSLQHKNSVFERMNNYFKFCHSSPHIIWMDHRIRRFIFKDINVSLVQGIETRAPFIDCSLQDFLFTLSSTFSEDSNLYKPMLCQFFPKYYQTIPWQSTGEPISPPNFTRQVQKKLVQFQTKVTGKLNQFGLSFPQANSSKKRKPYKDYANYAEWMRQNPAYSLYQTILENPNALYPEYLSPEETKKIKQNWQRHLNGEDLGDSVSLALTLELWLQQVFNQKYRTGE